MLRITVHDDPGCITFQLEGKLAGSWVQELRDCWQSTLAALPKADVRVDLTELTFIDPEGKAFLAGRHAEGTKLLAAGCLMRAIVAEISNCANSGRGRLEGAGSIPGKNQSVDQNGVEFRVGKEKWTA